MMNMNGTISKIILSLLLATSALWSQVTVYEAENAGTIYKAAIESEHDGFSGSGYVNYDNEPGGYIEWIIAMAETDSQTITIYYAHGKDDVRDLNIECNQVMVDSAKQFPPTGAWTSWSSVTAKVALDSGANILRMTAISAEGGPNIDRLEVTGLKGITQYELTVHGSGGHVDMDPPGGVYDENTSVLLTAVPDQQYRFSGWSGDLSGSDNPVTITMDSNKEVNALFEFTLDTVITDFDEAPMGFATLDGGTTGGAGGDTLIITDAQQLVDLMKPREKNIYDPLVIYISGTLSGLDDMIDFKRTGNITVLGLGTDAGFLGFGIKLVQSSNIIVRNLTFADCSVEEKDGLTIDESHNIWVDHCTFTDSPSYDPSGDNHDGLLDIKKGSYNVTISYNHLSNHRKTALFGHSVSETGDVNMKATYYRNWFDGTYSRNPRTRYGTVHLLNNLYMNNAGYGVGVTCAAQVMLEGNYFENTATPVLISQVNDPYETLSGDPEGYLKAVANFSYNSGDIVENLAGYDFDPVDFYDYTIDDSQKVKSIVMATAGAGKLDIGTVIREGNVVPPEGFVLEQNYPNPFNSSTTIGYWLSVSGAVDLSVYNVTGQKIVTLRSGNHPAGYNTIRWNASDYPSGIYYIHLAIVGQQQKAGSRTRRMVLIK